MILTTTHKEEVEHIQEIEGEAFACTRTLCTSIEEPIIGTLLPVEQEGNTVYIFSEEYPNGHINIKFSSYIPYQFSEAVDPYVITRTIALDRIHEAMSKIRSILAEEREDSHPDSSWMDEQRQALKQNDLERRSITG